MATNENIEVLHSLDKLYIDANMNVMLSELGNNIKFEDNVWLCDKGKKATSRKSGYKIYFTNIPIQYINLVKYYVIISRKKLSTKQSDVGKIGIFLNYLYTYENSLSLIKVNRTTIERYRRYVDRLNVAKSTRVKYLQAIADFFWKLDGWEELPTINPVNKRVHLYKRKKSDNEIKTKYIPDNITKELDKIFLSEEIPVHFKLYYWFCRMYPSRCSEISSLKIDCIKPFGEYYVLFKDEEKSSNDIGQSNLLNIYIKYEDMGMFLVDLYYKQKLVSQALQDKADDKSKGLLFLYNPIINLHNTPTQQNRVCLVLGTTFNKYIRKICKEKGLVDDSNVDIKITSHAFRHNGITDRLYEQFSTTSIRDLTGQKSDGEVLGTYHFRKKDEIQKLQRIALKNKVSIVNDGSDKMFDNEKMSKNLNDDNKSLVSSKVMFRGRIMNLDEGREQRILSNKRAYQISYSDKCIGICTDIASCNNGIFNCFGCDDFAPDSNELNFFKEEINFWDERIQYFQVRGSQYQIEHAIEVKGLFETIVLKIENINIRNVLGD